MSPGAILSSYDWSAKPGQVSWSDALLLEQNDEYAIQKRYMSLESLAPVSDNPPLRLPGTAAMA